MRVAQGFVRESKLTGVSVSAANPTTALGVGAHYNARLETLSNLQFSYFTSLDSCAPRW